MFNKLGTSPPLPRELTTWLENREKVDKGFRSVKADTNITRAQVTTVDKEKYPATNFCLSLGCELVVKIDHGEYRADLFARNSNDKPGEIGIGSSAERAIYHLEQQLLQRLAPVLDTLGKERPTQYQDSAAVQASQSNTSQPFTSAFPALAGQLSMEYAMTVYIHHRGDRFTHETHEATATFKGTFEGSIVRVGCSVDEALTYLDHAVAEKFTDANS